MRRVVCTICPHGCAIEEGGIGFCRARGNVGGNVTAINYGLITSRALDPIEKKPLFHFYPRSLILSVGSFGCNLRCSFCQNHEISMACLEDSQTTAVTPEALIDTAKSLVPKGNIGIAYTYNEPLIGYEFVTDCARAAKRAGLRNVLVTNGYVNEQPLCDLLPYVDALNIDLKAFTQEFYAKISGDLKTVKRTIEIAAARCHVEVTTLVIPGENDGEDEIRALSAWLASVDPGIPYHLSRFFPRFQMMDKDATEVSHLRKLRDIAAQSLKYVYPGNC
jgi:pyruvate formate lyase activating enzyme